MYKILMQYAQNGQCNIDPMFVYILIIETLIIGKY